MDGPGISLFQGGDSIRLSNSNQREEEEFLEEEKKRKAELQDLIDNAFSDFEEDEVDDDSSFSSSRCSRPCQPDYNQVNDLRDYKVASYPNSYANGLNYPPPESHKSSKENYIDNHHQYMDNVYEDHIDNVQVSAHKNHCFHANPPSATVLDENVIYKHTDMNGTNQMKVLYEVRLREIERLTKELEAEKEEKEQINRKYALCEHEKKNLELSLNTNNTLLIESRNKISELENEIIKLQKNAVALEKSKTELRSELEITRTQLYHEKQKSIALERSDLNVKMGKQMDLVIDNLKSSHRTEMNALQQELDAALERLNKKESDYNVLESKLEEMEQRHTANLLNKCDSAMRQEATIKTLLDETNKENLELTRKVNALQQECDMLRNDIAQYDSFPQLKLNGNSSSDEKDTDSFIIMSSTWKPESKRKGNNLTQSDLINKLKEELHRALMGQRSKRKEIMKLQEQVQSKELQIASLKELERTYLSQTEALKAEMNRILNHVEKSRNNPVDKEQAQLVIKLQSDLEVMQREIAAKSQKIIGLEQEISNLRDKLMSAEESYKNDKKDYLDFHETTMSKLQKDSELLLREKELEWGREMEKLITECDEVKQLYLDIKNKKNEISKKLEEMTKMRDDVMNEKTILEEQILKKQQIIKELEDHILTIGRDKKPDDNSFTTIQKEFSNIIEKQNIEINTLKSKLQNSAATDEELFRLKEEISQSKVRYIELEKTLKEEFQSSLIKLKEDNSALKDLLKKKEVELSLRKMCINAQKKDVSVGTEEALITETLNEQNFAEIDKLEKEIDKLRALDVEKTQEILKLTTLQEKRLYEELQKLEQKLTSQYQNDIAIAEKKVKELSLKCFSEEIEKLQLDHAKELKSKREEDLKQIEELKIVISTKEQETKNLNLKKDQLEALVKRYEEERNKTYIIMTKWAKEVGEIKEANDKLVVEIQQVQKDKEELSLSFEQLKTKLKETRKTALVYKRRLVEVKQNLSDKYKHLIADIQEKVDNAVSARELEIKEKLEQIENEYKSKEKLLKVDSERKDDT